MASISSFILDIDLCAPETSFPKSSIDAISINIGSGILLSIFLMLLNEQISSSLIPIEIPDSLINDTSPSDISSILSRDIALNVLSTDMVLLSIDSIM